MRKLNKQSEKTFNKLVKKLTDNYVKIDNTSGSFMPVSLEKLCETKFVNQKAVIYSLAHYYEQNGDLIPDPEMTFIQVSSGEVYPASINNGYAYRESLYVKDKTWLIHIREQHDQAYFANIWLKNIKYQQGL